MRAASSSRGRQKAHQCASGGRFCKGVRVRACMCVCLCCACVCACACWYVSMFVVLYCSLRHGQRHLSATSKRPRNARAARHERAAVSHAPPLSGTSQAGLSRQPLSCKSRTMPSCAGKRLPTGTAPPATGRPSTLPFRRGNTSRRSHRTARSTPPAGKTP